MTWELEAETERSGQFPTGAYFVCDHPIECKDEEFQDEEVIAKVFSLANARLIAKAPEMRSLVRQGETLAQRYLDAALTAGQTIGLGSDEWRYFANEARALLREIEGRPAGWE